MSPVKYEITLNEKDGHQTQNPPVVHQPIELWRKKSPRGGATCHFLKEKQQDRLTNLMLVCYTCSMVSGRIDVNIL